MTQSTRTPHSPKSPLLKDDDFFERMEQRNAEIHQQAEAWAQWRQEMQALPDSRNRLDETKQQQSAKQFPVIPLLVTSNLLLAATVGWLLLQG